MKKLKLVLDIMGDEKTKIPAILALFLVNAFLDLVGISLIGPFLAIIADPGYFRESAQGQFLLRNVSAFTELSLEVLVGVAICTLALIKAVLGIINGFVITRFCYRQQASLRVRLIRGYLATDYLSFLRRDNSDYIYVCNSLTSEYTKVVSIILKLTAEVLVALFLLGFLAYANPFVFIIMMIAASFAVILLDIGVRRPLVHGGLRVNSLMTSTLKTIIEALDLSKISRVFGAEEFFTNRLKKHVNEFARVATVAECLAELPRHIFEVFITFFIVLIVFYAVISSAATNETVSLIAVYGFAGIRLFPLMKSTSTTINQVRFRTATLHKLYDDLNRILTFQTHTKNFPKSSTTKFQTIEFREIVFGYQDADKPVITSANFKASKGEVLGIMGESGQGKTTFVNIILGLFEIHRGQILVNGQSVTTEEYREIQNGIGFVPQDIGIFNDTLLNNIVLNDISKLDKQKYERALKDANVSEFIATLPYGDKTFLGDRGSRLSGGQQQRVAIARALYHGKKLFVFDEPTSGLDTAGEKNFLSVVKRLSQDFPVILISHKETSLEICDRVYRLKDGKLS